MTVNAILGALPRRTLQLVSSLTPDANLRLRLAPAPLAEPGPDEVLSRVEASPINPSDLGAMLGPADVAQARVQRLDGDMETVIPMPATAMPGLAAKIGQALPAGVEGAGTVIAAGPSDQARALLGKVVALSAGAMYAQYRVAKLSDVLVMKDGTTAEQAASSFINPMTALGMIETMRREGRAALVHTAAASNLGQMLNRICLADGIPIVNVVRSDAQVEVLHALGAQHVVNSGAASFQEDLYAAIAATGATLCFDVIGGGKLIAQILTAMEAAQVAKADGYLRYGSSVHKQAYICGLLNPAPTELTHSFGMAWGVGGWLLTNFLNRAGEQTVGSLRKRVADEIGTTFASRYTRAISLREALDPHVIQQYCRRATGEKYLIAPHL